MPKHTKGDREGEKIIWKDNKNENETDEEFRCNKAYARCVFGHKSSRGRMDKGGYFDFLCIKTSMFFPIFLSQMKIIIVSFRQSICDICINESQSYPRTKCSNQSYIVLIVIVSLKHLLLAGNEWFNSEISRDVDLILFSRIFSTDEIERNTNDSLEMIVSDWRPFIKEIFQFPEDSPIQ